MVTAISEMNVYITARPQAQLNLETKSRVLEKCILSKTSLSANISLRDYDNGTKVVLNQKGAMFQRNTVVPQVAHVHSLKRAVSTNNGTYIQQRSIYSSHYVYVVCTQHVIRSKISAESTLAFVYSAFISYSCVF